ncbi:peptidyl-prolyl cis-trans isomerase 6-like [Oratosquilla oratoria]|uniref:peptidyl-prolyl cis-trans isomerase 6-like n=1 Tax=Oratosquilla oratoria TaxID=337810 RepID=UPI003F77030D
MNFGRTPSIVFVLAALLSVCVQVRSQVSDPRVTDEVTFEVTHGGRPVGSIVIGLFREIVPLTVANFVNITNGFNGRSYSGTPFHRIIKSFMIQGGDTTLGNGRGGESIYGRRFDDENFELKHYGKGWVSMANAGPNSNGSQFFITLVQTGWLDGAHVVFGKVVAGMDVVEALGVVETSKPGDKPVEAVIVKNASHAAVTPYPVKREAADSANPDKA